MWNGFTVVMCCTLLTEVETKGCRTVKYFSLSQLMWLLHHINAQMTGNLVPLQMLMWIELWDRILEMLSRIPKTAHPGMWNVQGFSGQHMQFQGSGIKSLRFLPAFDSAGEPTFWFCTPYAPKHLKDVCAAQHLGATWGYTHIFLTCEPLVNPALGSCFLIPAL